VAPRAVVLQEDGRVQLYEIWLTSEPVRDVVVTAAANSSAVTLATSRFLFTTSTWSHPQLVQVSVSGNDVDQGKSYAFQICHVAQSHDSKYDAINVPSAAITVLDDDTAAILVSNPTINVREGGGAVTYGLWLGSEPNGNVVIEISTADADVSVLVPSAGTLFRVAFNAANWQQHQPISIAAVDDEFDEANGEFAHILHRVVRNGPADSAFAGLEMTLNVVVGDNDMAPLPDGYAPCSARVGPTHGLTRFCLQPVFLLPGNASNITEQSIEDRHDNYYIMVLANEQSIRCHFTFVRAFQTSSVASNSRPQRLEVHGLLNGTAIVCITPAVELEGIYSVEVYVGEDYGVRGWIDAPDFYFMNLETVMVTPSLGPRAGGTLVSAGVALTTDGDVGILTLESTDVAASCRLDAVYSAEIDGTTYRTEKTTAVDAIVDFAAHQTGRVPLVCATQRSANLGEDCVDLCGPQCDKPAEGESICKYCRPECNVRVHVRAEAFGEEIYYRVNDDDEMGNIGSFADVFNNIHLYGTEHTLTFVDSNGGGWSGGFIEVLDAATQDVLLPPYYVAASSGSVVVEQTGETQGALPFSCASHSVVGQLPACSSASDECRCHETCMETCASYRISASLNGQQYTESAVDFNYYQIESNLRLIPDKGPVHGGTLIEISGVGVVGSDYAVCRFVDDNSKLVDVRAVSNTSDTVLCESPPSALATKVNLTVALNGQQFHRSPARFEYYAKPAVTRVFPDHRLVGETGTETMEITVSLYTVTPFVFYRFELSGKAEQINVEGQGTNKNFNFTFALSMPFCHVARDVSIYISTNGQQYAAAAFGFHCLPIVNSVHPVIGPLAGGTLVTIEGLGFAAAGMECRFGGTSVNATVHNVSSNITGTTITCVSPLSSRGNAALSVAVGESVSLEPFTFAHSDAPEPLRVHPLVVPVSGDSRFPSTPIDIDILIDLDIPTFDVTVFVGMHNGVIRETETPAVFLPEEPARLQFSSHSLNLKSPGDRVLQISLNGQQYQQFDNVVFNVFDPCIPAAVNSLSPKSGPVTGGNATIIGSNFARMEGAVCSQTSWCTIPGTANFVECGEPVSPIASAAIITSHASAMCLISPYTGTDLPHKIVIRIKNADYASSFCTQPWGFGADWSAGAVDFRYTAIVPHECRPLDITSTGTVGDVSSFVVQSFWGGTPAYHGGDSFNVHMTDADARAFVVDLDVLFTDYSEMSDTLNYDIVQQLAATLSVKPNDNGLCADTANHGACCRTLTSQCSQNVDGLGKYLVALRTTIAGQHQISVNAAGIPIQDSPISIRMAPADLGTLNSRCASASEAATPVVAGTTHSGVITLKDIYGNPRTDDARMDSNELVLLHIELDTRFNAKDIYWILVPAGSVHLENELVAQTEPFEYVDFETRTHSYYLPAGEYTLMALSAGTLTPVGWHGAALKMTINGDVILEEKLFDFGAAKTIPVHVGLHFEVLLFLCSASVRSAPSRCNVESVGDYPQIAAASFTAQLGKEVAPGVHYFGVRPFRSGVFVMQTEVNGEVLLCNDTLVVTSGKVAAETSSLSTSLAAYEVGVPGVITLQPRDQFSNLQEFGGDSVDAHLALGNISCDQCIIGLHAMNESSNYRIIFNTTVSGKYDVSVWIDSLQAVRMHSHLVGAMPYSMTVISGSFNLLTSFLSDGGTLHAQAGIPTSFEINACDQYGNLMTSSVLQAAYALEFHPVFEAHISFRSRQDLQREPVPPADSSITCPTVVEYGTGAQFHATYTCTLSGTYLVHVEEYENFVYKISAPTLNGTGLVTAGIPSPAQSIVYGTGCSDSQAGAEAFVLIQLIDGYGNENLANTHAEHISFSFLSTSTTNTSSLLAYDRPGVYPESYRLSYDGAGVFRITYLFVPASSYIASVLVAGGNTRGNGTQTREAECKSPFVITKTKQPAPVLSSVELDDSLIRVRALFDVPTDMSPNLQCNMMFPADVLAMLGEGFSCYWETHFALIIELGSANGLNVSLMTIPEAHGVMEPSSGSWSDFDPNVLADAVVLVVLPVVQTEYQNSLVASSALPILGPQNLMRPVAVIDGGHSVSMCDTLSLSCQLSYGGGPDPLQCRWEVTNQGEQRMAGDHLFSDYIASNFNSSRTVVIPASRLRPHATYSIQLTVMNSIGISAYTVWDFRRLEQPTPKATLPANVLVDYNYDILVRSAVFISDAACHASGNEVHYFWRQRNRRLRDGLVLHKPAAKDLHIRADQLEHNQSYIFELFAWFKDSNRLDLLGEPTAVVTVSGRPLTDVLDVADYNSPLAIRTSQLSTAVNVNKRIVFTLANIEHLELYNASYRWWVLQGLLNLNDLAVAATGRTKTSLVLAAGVLTAGQYYRFCLQAVTTGKFTNITIRTNRPPTMGEFSVTPTVGEAITTKFVLSASTAGFSAWVDDFSDMPIRYRFSYVQQGAEFPLSMLSLQPKRTVTLPEGDPTDAYKLTVLAYITDQYGAASRIPARIRVDSASSDDSIGDYVQSLRELSKISDHEAVVAGCLVGAMSLNNGDPLAFLGRRRLQSAWVMARMKEEWEKVLQKRIFRQTIREDLATMIYASTEAAGHRELHSTIIAAMFATNYDPCEMSMKSNQEIISILMVVLTQQPALDGVDLTRLLSVIDKTLVSVGHSTELCSCPKSLCRVPFEDENTTGTETMACPVYSCVEGRCFDSPLPQHSTCSRDGFSYRDTGGQWYAPTCEPGYCTSSHARSNCSEGKCVWEGGRWKCFPGACDSGRNQKTYTGRGCNLTSETKLTAELTFWRSKHCMASNIHTSLFDTLVASNQHVVEEPVAFSGTSFTAVTTTQADAQRAADGVFSSFLVTWQLDLLEYFPDYSHTSAGNYDALWMAEDVRKSTTVSVWDSRQIEDIDRIHVKFPGFSLPACSYNRSCTTADGKLIELAPICMAWNFDSEQWVDSQCEVNFDDQVLQCLCEQAPRGPMRAFTTHRVLYRTNNSTNSESKPSALIGGNQRTSWLPVTLFVSLWFGSCILIGSAIANDRRARHQIYIADAIRESVRPRETHTKNTCCQFYLRLYIDMMVNRHMILSTCFVGGRRVPHVASLACMLFSTLAVCAFFFQVNVTRHRLWDDRLAAAVDIDAMLKTAFGIAVLLTPADVMFSRLFAMVGPTPAQQHLASRGDGGRDWSMPSVGHDARVLTMQQRVRRFLSRLKLQKLRTRQAQVAETNGAAVDAVRINVDFATRRVKESTSGPAQLPPLIDRRHPEERAAKHLKQMEDLTMFYGNMRTAQERAGWIDDAAAPAQAGADVDVLRGAASSRLHESMAVLPVLKEAAAPVLTDVPFKKVWLIPHAGDPADVSRVSEAEARSQSPTAGTTITKLRQTKSRLWLTNEQDNADNTTLVGPMVAALTSAYRDDSRRRAVTLMVEHSVWTADEFVGVLVRLQRRIRAVLRRRIMEQNWKVKISYDPFASIIAQPTTDPAARRAEMAAPKQRVRTQEWNLLIYGVGFVWCVVCTAGTLHLHAKMQPQQTTDWAICCAIVIGIQMLVTSPFCISLWFVATKTVAVIARCRNRKLRQIFEQIDTDGSGTISRAELVKLLRTMASSQVLDTRSMSDTFDSMDADGDGEVEFGEFAKWWARVARAQNQQNQRHILPSEPDAWASLTPKQLAAARRAVKKKTEKNRRLDKSITCSRTDGMPAKQNTNPTDKGSTEGDNPGGALTNGDNNDDDMWETFVAGP
jgi:hypothetical protein